MSNPGIYSRWYQVMHLLASYCIFLQTLEMTTSNSKARRATQNQRSEVEMLSANSSWGFACSRLGWLSQEAEKLSRCFLFSWYCCSPRCASAVIVCWSVFGADPVLEFSCLIGCGTVSTMRGFTSCSFHDSTGASEAVKAVPIGFILDRACGKVRLCSTWPTVQQLGQPLYRKCWGRWRATKACKTLQDKAVGWYRLALGYFHDFACICALQQFQQYASILRFRFSYPSRGRHIIPIMGFIIIMGFMPMGDLVIGRATNLHLCHLHPFATCSTN